MRKILCTLCIAFTLIISSISVVAETTKYQPNLFTDESTIEEDLQNLNIDINDYYKPKYNYGKWYVVGMSEGYVDTDTFDIQTYFYIYNPSSPKNYEYWYQDNDDAGEEHFNQITDFNLTYKLSGKQDSNLAEVLSINYDHHLYKIKGFIYNFKERAEIEILNIQNFMTTGFGFVSKSTFKAICNHSKLNGFSVELAFNSTIIIDSVEVVGMEIQPNNSFFTYIFSGEFFEDIFKDGVNSKKLQLYFYNFNFPDHIKPDSIEKAVFQYNKELWKKKYRLKDFSAPELLSDDRISSEEVISELLPGEFSFDIGNKREPITFPRFYLGDRIKDKQFGDLEFTSTDKASFNYDCSIFLDYNYELEYDRFEVSIFGKRPDTRYQEYSKLKDVELIELWYEKDSILYKCQVVSSPTDSKPMYPNNPKSNWDRFVEWFMDNFPMSALLVIGIPVLIIIVAIFFPQIFVLGIKGFFNAIQSLVQFIVKFIRVILSILTFPFRLIIRIFKRE